MDLISAQHFAGAAGASFDVSVGAASVPMTLTEVKPLPAPLTTSARRDPFYLLFKSSSPVILPQQIYQMRNRQMGAMGIFLVPVARDSGGIVYQAVFN
jgi:hypothetical protein